MSAKNLLFLGAALVAAIVLWIAAELVSRESDRVEEGVLFGEIAPDAIDSAVFAGPDDTLRLVRTVSGAWEVNGFPAMPEAGAQLLDAVTGARRGRLIAQSSSSHERMGVDSAGAVRLRVFDGADAVADLFIGERGRGYRTIYVRAAGAEPVYAIEGALDDVVHRSLTGWRDKRIVTVDPGGIGRVAVARGDETYALERGADGWVADDGAPADSQRVAQLLEEFRSLEAQGAAFAAPAQADSADFARPDRAVTLLGGTGDTLAALVFDSTENGFWTRHRSGGTVYLLYGRKVNALTPARTAFGGR